MSHRTMPLLFLNLGGEMMYILDQRLQAQSILEEKAKKVRQEIIGMMVNQRFIEELFKSQVMYPKRSMKTMFDRLAHASIMRLNSSSMDKLYDLMTMAFKYQVYMCPRPSDLLLVTLNHLDSLGRFAAGNKSLTDRLVSTYDLLMKNYSKLSASEWQFIRQTMLKFFQDIHTKVSVFLKDKTQTQNGWFVLNPVGPVPYGSEVPGSIRCYDNSGFEHSSTRFPLPQSCRYEPPPLNSGSASFTGSRGTSLGTNIYTIPVMATTVKQEPAPEKSVSVSSQPSSSSSSKAMDSETVASAELKLLTHLLGGLSERKVTGPTFKLNLFDFDEDDSTTVTPQPMLSINASQTKSKQLSEIMDDFTLTDSTHPTKDKDKGDDLLDLMDSCS
eukprot:m.37418 g.37418  ORF g.37418 m.37418 type:complete len:385 (+) comp32376_c0_seq4:45-1199(+)